MIVLLHCRANFFILWETLTRLLIYNDWLLKTDAEESKKDLYQIICQEV